MPVDGVIADLPTPAEVRAALDRMLADEIFRGSPQLAAFLRFVVEAVLNGDGDSIKGYTIGVEVLHRGADFDPQADPIVRVEATRLRRALERYYAGPGNDSSVRIDLVRGSYAPAFSYRSASAPGAAALSGSGYRPGDGMPRVLIRPLEILEAAGTPALSAVGLHEKLCDAFARFDTISVIVAALGAEDPAADYELTGSIEFRDDGTTRVHFRLSDIADSTVVWSRAFARMSTAGGRAAAEDAIITELAAILLQPFGVIRAHERVRHLASGIGDPRYRCIVEASESFRSFEPAQNLRARACLEHLTATDPSFAIGFAYLAAIYFREYQYGYSGQQDDTALLDRALAVARRAIELKPESSRAYQILFGVLFARHELAAAFAAGEKAMDLNRYDMTVLSDYGGRLVMTGEVKRGMEMLAHAAEFGTVRPSWQHFYLFLGGYITGDLTNMVHHASQITNDNYPLGLIAHALAAIKTGERERAAQAFARLKALRPAWISNMRGELARFFPVPELADRIVDDLTKGGLALAS